MNIPAFCNQCGRVVSSGITASNCTNITISNCGSTCTFCGGEATTIEGTFSFIGDTIEIIKANNITKERLSKLLKVLEVKKSTISSDELNETVVSEIPELKGLTSIIPNTKAELYAFISILISIIQLFLGSQTSVTNNINIENVYQQVQVQSQSEEYLPIQTYSNNQSKKVLNGTIVKKPKIGRNVMCPCGSGKKFKNCCSDGN